MKSTIILMNVFLFVACNNQQASMNTPTNLNADTSNAVFLDGIREPVLFKVKKKNS